MTKPTRTQLDIAAAAARPASPIALASSAATKGSAGKTS